MPVSWKNKNAVGDAEPILAGHLKPGCLGMTTRGNLVIGTAFGCISIETGAKIVDGWVCPLRSGDKVLLTQEDY